MRKAAAGCVSEEARERERERETLAGWNQSGTPAASEGISANRWLG